MRNRWGWVIVPLGLLMIMVAAIYARPAPVEAKPTLAADITSVCQQIPSLLQAYDYTDKYWPVANDANIQKAGPDTVARLLYFYSSVKLADQYWCDLMKSSPLPASQTSQPDLVFATFNWNFGNASEALVQYQQAVGAH